MMDRLTNHQAFAMAGQIGQAGVMRRGIVESVNAANYTVRCTLQPDETLTGWCPVQSVAVGNGWGIVALPAVGTQVLLGAEEGDGGNYAILGALYSLADAPPAAPAGEWWLVHTSGAKVKLMNTGHMSIEDSAGTKLELTADGNAVLTGNLLVSGDIRDNYGSNGNTVAAMRTIYNGHTHPDAQGGTTGTPNQKE